MKDKEKTPWYIKFIKELINFFALLLWLACVLSFIAYALNPSDPSNMILGIVIIVVIFLTASITYLQNAKSEAIMEGFKDFIP